VDFMVQKVIAFALEKVLLAGHLASSIATAGAIAAAWAPAATAVNIASFGAAGIAAASSAMVAGAATAGAMTLSSTGVSATRGIEVSVQSALGTAGPAFADGTTKVPYDMTARIHKNEMIVPAGFAEDIRKGELSLGSGGNINVNIYYPKMSSKEEVETLARALGFEIEKQMRYARTI
jgi:hypothetical protein